MTVKGLPFDSVEQTDENGIKKYDRPVFSADIAKYLGFYASNGIILEEGEEFSNQLEVSVNGLNFTVQPGAASVNGRMGWIEDFETVEGYTGGLLPRIDRVVFEMNTLLAERRFLVRVVQGEEAEEPIPPKLTRNQSVYQIGLATAYISANSLLYDSVTDTRGDLEICRFSHVKVPSISQEVMMKWQKLNPNLQTLNQVMEYIVDYLTGSLPPIIPENPDTPTIPEGVAIETLPWSKDPFAVRGNLGYFIDWDNGNAKLVTRALISDTIDTVWKDFTGYADVSESLFIADDGTVYVGVEYTNGKVQILKITSPNASGTLTAMEYKSSVGLPYYHMYVVSNNAYVRSYNGRALKFSDTSVVINKATGGWGAVIPNNTEEYVYIGGESLQICNSNGTVLQTLDWSENSSTLAALLNADIFAGSNGAVYIINTQQNETTNIYYNYVIKKYIGTDLAGKHEFTQRTVSLTGNPTTNECYVGLANGYVIKLDVNLNEVWLCKVFEDQPVNRLIYDKTTDTLYATHYVTSYNIVTKSLSGTGL